MLDVILILGFVAMVIAFVAYPIVMIELSLPINPFCARRGIRERREHRQASRISKLEHDLGYLPCSDSNCYTCTMKIKYDVPEITRVRWVPPRG
jgi:hypothetical protein